MSSAAPTKTAERERGRASAGPVPEPSRSTIPGGPYDGIMRLQRAAGNHAVSHWVQRNRGSCGCIQPKLVVGHAGDAYEQEADHVADVVMRTPESLSTEHIPGLKRNNIPSIQRLCTECEEEAIRTKESPGATPEVTPEIESGIQALRGSGQPLPETVRAFFEPRLGSPLGHVRVHTDMQAAGMARAVSARAFTVGHDVAFAAGEYAPETPEGRRLLAHELTHVVQQAGGTAGGQAQVTAGTEVLGGLPDPISSGAGISGVQNATVQRQSTGVGGLIGKRWLQTDPRLKELLVDEAIGLASGAIDYFPGKELAGPLWIFLKEGLHGFFGKLKSAAKDVKILVMDKIAGIFAGEDKAFTLAFLKGLLKGFFIDGALGIFIAIWDLMKGLKSVWDFFRGITAAIPEAILSLLRNFEQVGQEILNSIGPAIDEVKKYVFDPQQASSLSSVIVEKGKGYAKQGGEALAQKSLDFFSKPQASAELGEAAGDLMGMALWEVVFAAITAGGGAAVTAVKEAAGSLSKILVKIAGKVLKVVEEIKLLFGKVINVVKEAISFVKGKLNELGSKFAKLLEDAEEFMAKLLRMCRERSPVVCDFPEVAATQASASTKVPVKKLPPGKPPPPQRIGIKETLPEGLEDILEHEGMSIRERRTPPGAKPPPENAEVGEFAHKRFEELKKLIKERAEEFTSGLKEGLEKEHQIPHPDYKPGYKPRIDRLDWEAAEVIEIKPKHLERQGFVEAQQYAEWMNKYEKRSDGQLWKPRVVTYDMNILRNWLKKNGVLK